MSHAEFVDKSHAASPELTALRHSRRDSQGCSCACVRADKLNLAKLRGELNKRSVLEAFFRGKWGAGEGVRVWGGGDFGEN